ncbi:MAG: hypothetical protein K2X86_18555 [Cytophagaceae bacterium]|nr:hypothetical protein [Cytophagaceae bacterium]
MKKSFFIHGLKIFVCVIACGLLLGSVVMLLWNWIIPNVFQGANEINFPQALGLFLLGRILIGGFKGWRSCGSNCGCGTGGSYGYKGYWKKRFEEKLSSLSPEEREKLKEKYKKCCGYDDEEQKG